MEKYKTTLISIDYTSRLCSHWVDTQSDLIIVCWAHMYRGGSRISKKGVHMYKSVGGSLCCFYLIFLKSHENEIIWSH